MVDGCVGGVDLVIGAESRGFIFGAAVARYLDGGVCAGTPSTVVAIGLDDVVTLVRAGAIVLPELARA